MKKYLLMVSTMLTITVTNAQQTTPSEAVRLAVENLTGSARFRAMSGAFGALGGDLSAINQNPAGSVFFNNNFATFSATSFNSNNVSRYFGSSQTQNDHTFDLNQAGVVFVFEDNNPRSDWKKFSIALNYELNNNLDNRLHSVGVNPFNSIDQYFLRFANGLPQEGGITLQTLENASFENLNFIDQQAFLGYQAFIFNPLSNSPQNTTYVSNVPTNGNYLHDNISRSRGYDGKFTFNFATAYKDKLFLGVNLNYHSADITKTNSIFESYNNPDPTGLQSVQFDTQTRTFGNGFSLNIGTIFKATESLRLGLSYQSPTWFWLQDEQTQAIYANCPSCDNGNAINFNPQVTMIYPSYRIQTPGKWTGSMAYIFGKKGLISADVTTKDYSTTQFRPQNDFANLNSFMSNALQNAIEVRIGGEYKFKQYSFRAGYRFDQSPYKSKDAFGDLTGYSSGLGYSFGDSRIDLAYSYEQRNFSYTFLSSGLIDPAMVNRRNNNVTISYSMNF